MKKSSIVVIESNTDLDDDINEEVEESIQLSRKDILNSTNLDESLSITSSLQDDTADMLTIMNKRKENIP